jgi:nitrogen fixation protein NifQ
MSALQVDAADLMPREAEDEVLMQRVVLYVLDAAAQGKLPRIPWHMGLSESERQNVESTWLPSIPMTQETEQRIVENAPAQGLELLGPLREMLLAHRARPTPLLAVLSNAPANALASACFGSHPLWQNLGASGCGEVSRLLEVGLPGLFRSNIHNLRWKCHLFAKLGEQLGRDGSRAPRCDGCEEYEFCFGAAAPLPWTWPLTPLSERLEPTVG